MKAKNQVQGLYTGSGKRRKMTVGQRIKKERKSLGLSQGELAKKTGISDAFICQIEKDNRDFSIKRLIKFAEVFGVTTDYLLGLILQQPSPYSQP